MQELEDNFEEAKLHDEWVRPRLEFMMDNLDYDHDRANIRARFARETHTKSQLYDIGGLLDALTLDSKAKIHEFWNPAHHILETAKSPHKDQTSEQFNAMDDYLASLDPVKPDWFDDDRKAMDMSPLLKHEADEIKDEINWRDA